MPEPEDKQAIDSVIEDGGAQRNPDQIGNYHIKLIGGFFVNMRLDSVMSNNRLARMAEIGCRLRMHNMIGSPCQSPKNIGILYMNPAPGEDVQDSLKGEIGQPGEELGDKNGFFLFMVYP